MKLFSILALSLAAPNINLDNQREVQQTLKIMVDNLMAYYTRPGASFGGTLKQNTASDASGFQWYEGGIMWGAVMEYIRVTGDATYATTVVNALTEASFRQVGSFLGTSEALAITVEGKWNDDILWWSLGTLTGMELFGKDTLMPGGVTYAQVTDKTYQQVQAQEDPSCGGGIWWSRNRNDQKSKNYKSSITLTQQMMKGARLFILTNNRQYQIEAERTYNWMRSRLITADGAVNDGLDTEGCRININKLSYKSGFLVGALAWMYQATKNQQFLDAAHLSFTQGLSAFAPGGIIRDACEPRCARNQVSPKGTMVRGWGYLQEFTNDNRIRAQLRQVLRASAEAMLASCDDNLNCLDNWSSRVPVSPNTPSDVHQQMNAVELMTAYLKTFTNGPAGVQRIAPPTQAPPAEAVEPGSAFGTFQSGVTLLVLGVTMTLLL